MRAPSGTTVHFGSLIALAFGTAATIYWVMLPSGLAAWFREFERCQVRSGYYPWQLPLPRPDAEQRYDDLAGCLAERMHDRLLWTALALLGMFTVAVLLYRLQPWWRIRRQRLVELRSSDAPELTTYLESLVVETGLPRAPVFLVDPFNPRAGGLAFGHGRRRYVRLDAGLLTLFRNDPASFRAVVLHELAHVRDRDVPITYFALAVWRSFLITALAPLAVGLLWVSWQDGAFRSSLGISWRVAGLVLLVHLFRDALLRSREHHADARVSAWLGSADPSLCLPALPGTVTRWPPVWLRRHPTPSSRVAALPEPTALFRPGFGEHFAAGIVLQLGFVQFAMPIVTAGAPLDVLRSLSAVWGVSVALLVGFAAVRGAAVARAGGRARGYPAGIGVGVVVGALLGERLSLSTLRDPLPGVVVLLAGGLLAVQLVLLSRWVHRCSLLLHRNRLAWVRVLGWSAIGTAVSLLGWSWLRLWAFFESLRLTPSVFGRLGASITGFAAEAAWTDLDRALLSVTWNPVVLGFGARNLALCTGLVLLWAVQLLLAHRTRIRFALSVGLLGAAAWLVFDLAVKAAMRGTVPLSERSTDAFRAVLSAWEFAGAVAVQFTVAAVVAAVLFRRAGLAHALFVAATTGLIVSGMMWVFARLGACVPPLHATATRCPGTTSGEYAATVLGVVTVEGTVAALVGYLLGSTVRRGARRWSGSRGPEIVRTPVGAGTSEPGRAGRIVAVLVAASSIVVLALPNSSSETGEESSVPVAAAERTASEPPESESGTAPGRVWLRHGGSRHLRAVSSATVELGDGIRSNAEVREVRGSAVRLAEAVTEAREFPEPPDSRRAEIWGEALGTLDDSARRLVEALDTGTLDREALLEVVESLARGVRLFEELIDLWCTEYGDRVLEAC
ncbi:M48 family metalloprotease [Actinopolyspora alba]|uniref:M48 family metalloprotease n=1 Tax=Actinopolyspora alba TaxID=673379 RepID=UPI000B87F96F|nr:M48 family metalloprotease [Actinopolyspora alba]